MPQSTVTILAYHRIAEQGSRDLSPTLIDAYPPAFEAQMRYLASHYNVISSWDVARALREGYTLPERALVITFDDGYSCFRDTAHPILKRLGLPVTLFVATDFTTNPTRLFWWDEVYRALHNTRLQEIEIAGIGRFPLHNDEQRMLAYDDIVASVEHRPEKEAFILVDQLVEKSGVEPNRIAHLLGWDDIKALSDDGVAIGAHTRHHPILAQTTPERTRDEIEGSWADLSARITNPLPIFCYPNGQPYAVNRAAKAEVKRIGLAGAVTMVAGLNTIGKTDPYLLYRVGAVTGETLTRFRLKIGPLGPLYRRLKSLVTRKPLPRFDA